jgi:ribosomal protein S18 acetylase RimI-like enzyme
MNIAIRDFDMQHFENVLDLWKRSEGIGLSAADSPERISAYLNRNPGMSFTAWDGDRLVGAVLCGHDGRRGYLHHLAVDPEYRRMGIGRRLSDACMAALAREGIDKAHIFVYGENQDGLAFWQQAGWYQRHELVIMSYDVKKSKGG